MNSTIRLLGFAGSLRKGSFNKALLRAASELLPSNVELEIFDLEGLPPYNMDLENSFPTRVVEFKAKIKAADALVIATKEVAEATYGLRASMAMGVTTPTFIATGV